MKELFDAIEAGDLAAVQRLVSASPALASVRDENGVSAYVTARYRRQPAIADYLLSTGMELDIFDATVAGNTARVEELLQQDRTLTRAYSKDGWTPLHLASFFGQAETAEALLAHGAEVNTRSLNGMQNTPLHAAAAGHSKALIKLLLARGADVNARQPGGWTVLHAAAQNGDVQMILLLLDAGAELNARADNNQNPMDLAMSHGHQEVTDILDHHGAGR